MRREEVWEPRISIWVLVVITILATQMRFYYILSYLECSSVDGFWGPSGLSILAEYLHISLQRLRSSYQTAENQRTISFRVSGLGLIYSRKLMIWRHSALEDIIILPVTRVVLHKSLHGIS